MKNIFLTTIIALSSFTSIQAQQYAKGYVYQDANKNGKKDKHEKGIPAVAVSNGRDIVETNDKGQYQIPIQENDVLFVIKPAGYQFALDQDSVPDFYYTYKPNGSPSHYKFAGVEPTGKLPKSIDFALHPTSEDLNFTALIFGDPQMRNKVMLDYFDRKIISELEGVSGISFGISMGDTSDEDLSLMGDIKQLAGKIGIPWYYVVGNHDVNYDADEDKLSTETFIKYYGPTDYSFNYGAAHFLVIDNICFPNPDKPNERRWVSRSGLREDQRQFIQNDLAIVPNNKLLVLFMHVPMNDVWNTKNDIREFLMSQLQKFDNVLVVSSHQHWQEQQFYTKAEGWMGQKPLHEYIVGTTCGSWYSGFPDENGIPESKMVDGTPQGYAFLHVKGNKYELDYKVAGQPKEYQIAVMNPKVVVKDRHTPSYITANFFMGAQGDTVQYRIDNGEWKDMTYTQTVDPDYQYMYYTWERSEEPRTTRWPSAPRPSTHIWRVLIPSKGLDIGEHQIEVRATDRYGKVSHGSSSYRIVEPLNNDYP